MSQNKFKSTFLKYAAVILVIFYVGFAIIDGPVWAKDSASYTGMAISREPVYPLFLAFFRMIFGEEAGRNGLPAYLFPAVIVQSLVNAYAVWVLVRAVLHAAGVESEGTGTLTHFSEKRVSVPVPLTHLLLAALAGDFHLIVALLNRFVAGRASMYSEAILTESLAMPLYLIFVVRLWEKKSNLRLTVLAFLLIGLRKQMAVVLVLWGVVAVVDCLRKHIPLTRLLLTIATIIFILVANNGFERAYNAAVHDRAVTHTGNGKGMMCTLLYSADPDEDTVYFQNCQTGGLCELFTDILATCDEMGILKKNYDEGIARYYISADGQPVEGAAFHTTGSWLNLGEHYAASYDVIGYEVCDPMIAEYLAERGFTGVDAEIAYDTIAQEFNRVLMGQKKGDLLKLFCINFAKGLVATNARIHPALVPVSLMLYVLYVALYVPFVTSNRIGTLRLAELTFLAILINAGVVGLMIFPQPRYMIYNMGLFYTALAMMAFMLYSKVWITKKHTNVKS